MTTIDKLRLGAAIDRDNREAYERAGNCYDLYLTDWHGETILLDSFRTAREAFRVQDFFADRFMAYTFSVVAR